MIIGKKLGNLSSYSSEGKTMDRVELEWFDSAKRIQRKITNSGKEITLKFLNENPQLTQDDVLADENNTLIVVEILACEVMILKPSSLQEMASACYEIGNKHLPLFYEADKLVIPYDAPTFRMLKAAGFDIIQTNGKLLNPLKTSVTPHGYEGNSKSLFSKIIQMTTKE